MPAVPLVSVITATYNMGRYVQEAVDSVLAQKYPRVQSIVVDDGSTDDTPEVLARYRDDSRVTVIRQENAGQTAAKNSGLAAAAGEYIGFCDADNAWLPGKLARQLEMFRAHPRLGVVYGDIELMDENGIPLPAPATKRYSGRITGRLLVDNFVTFNTALVPRAVIVEAGGFDESLSMAIDYDLWLRISVNYEFMHIAAPLVRYRIWGGQMSHRTGERLDNYLRLLQRFLSCHPESVTAGEVRRAWAHTYVTRGLWHAAENRKGAAWRDYGRALVRWPHDLRLWKSAARLLLGR